MFTSFHLSIDLKGLGSRIDAPVPVEGLTQRQRGVKAAVSFVLQIAHRVVVQEPIL